MCEVSVLIADNRPFVRGGLKSVLRDEPGFVVVGEVDTMDQAIELSRDVRPSVVVMVSSLIQPVGVGGLWITRFRDLSPPPGVVVLSSAADDHARRAVDAGAAGLLLEQCSPEVMRAALRMVADGYTLLAPPPAMPPPEGGGVPANRVDPGLLATLTQREFDVFELVARGRTNVEICKALSLSRNTVKSHMRSLLLKLGLRSRVETIIYAYESGAARVPPRRSS